MAKLDFKVPVAVAKFPFDYAKASRAVLRPELDVVSRAPVSFAGSTESIDHNVLQLLHCENMMPVDTGMRAAGFWRTKAGFGSSTGLKQMFPLASSTSTSFWTADVFARWTADGLSWQATTGTAMTPTACANISRGGNNDTYLLQPGAGANSLATINSAGAVSAVSATLPAGYTINGFRSICGAGNYLIAVSQTPDSLNHVLWSSLTTPTNFVDTTSGAGRATPNTDIGYIHSVRQVLDGFILFGTKGAIGASATNDATRPFIFRAIPGSLGTADRYAIPISPVTSDLYVKTVGGIQRITLQRAETVFPDAYDFLRQSSHSIFSGQVAQSAKNAEFQLNYVLGRYVILSYAPTNVPPLYDGTIFSRALIYDIQLQRWGQVALNHSTTFAESGFISANNAFVGRIAFVQQDGITYNLVTDADLSWAAAPGGSILPNGVAVFGHIKATRGRFVTFQEAVIDGALNGSQVYLMPALVGHNRPSTVSLTFVASDGSRSTIWRGRYTSDNFDLAIVGPLDLSTILVSVTVHGSR